MRVELADELREPGPARSAAITAIAATLKRDLYVCQDRGRIVAARALDAALEAAERALHPPPSPGDP